jgi:hypothetical protein
MTPTERKALGAVLTAACTALALTACATSQPSAVRQSQTSSHGSASVAAARAATSATGQTPEQQAEADAAAILRSFAVPPGGRRLGGPPNLPGGVLKSPITYLGAVWEVHVTGFWEAPGTPQSLLAWEQAHLSARFTLGDADFGPPAWDREFDPCPFAPGPFLTLTFRARAGSLPVAVVETDQSCGGVTLTVGGRPQPTLQNESTLDDQILKLAALAWKLR